MSERLTDGQAMSIARRIDHYNEQITKLCHLIADGHPNGRAMLEDMGGLRDNCFDNPASAEHVIHAFLLRPEDWDRESDYGEYKHIAAAQAVRTRQRRGT